jgi:hypothetical protein
MIEPGKCYKDAMTDDNYIKVIEIDPTNKYVWVEEVLFHVPQVATIMHPLSHYQRHKEIDRKTFRAAKLFGNQLIERAKELKQTQEINPDKV